MDFVIGYKRDRDIFSEACEFVNFIVGGRYFSIKSSLLAAYPESYFHTASKKIWHRSDDNVIVINRDGSLFQHVVDFHNFGMLPYQCNENPLTLEEIKAIQDEADFYMLPAMINACDLYVIEQINKVNCVKYSECIFSELQEFEEDDEPQPIITTVLREIWAPACIIGFCNNHFRNKPLIQSSSLEDIHLPELLTLAEQGQDCKFILAANLDQNTMTLIATYFCPDVRNHFSSTQATQSTPYKLLIVQTGENAGDALRADLSSADNEGALVYILNRRFEGGRIRVNCNNKSVSIAKRYEWIALTSDCPYTHDAVVSGTQLLLVSTLTRAGPLNRKALTSTDIVDYLWDSVQESNDNINIFDGKINKSVRPVGIAQPLRENTRQKICAALSTLLTQYDTVVIGLTHYYHLLRFHPEQLINGDAVLYSVLHDFLDSEQLDLSLTIVVLDREIETIQDFCSRATGGMVDLSFGRGDKECRTKMKLIMPKAYTSDVTLNSRVTSLDDCPLEATKHLFSGFRIGKRE